MAFSSFSERGLTILGLMTGSSADGLDLCLVRFYGNKLSPLFEILYSDEIPYPTRFSNAFRNPLSLSALEIDALDHDLGKWFSDEIQKLNLTFDAIASHGQTIRHEPPFFSRQIGYPGYMANQFNVPVVYDFRTADIELGGQGAPLIPVVDQLLFQNNMEDILALNIGGIANLTIIPSQTSNNSILAWDTGPGNTLIDKAVRVYTKDKFSFDPDGSIAAQGVLNPDLLKYLSAHEFYRLAPPKSAGQEQFGLFYFKHVLTEFYPKNDQEFKDFIYTLTVLSAKSIASSVKQLCSSYSPHTLYAAGGGVKNRTLIKLLREALPGIAIKRTDHKGVDENNKESFGFAYLGYLHMAGLPGNIPSVTGAQKKVILGKTFFPINLNMSIHHGE